jgi:hypothetical protein
MLVASVRLGPQMGQHVVTPAALPFGAQGSQVDRTDNDLLPRSRLGLGKNAAIVIDNHTASRPTERRVVL